MNGREAEANCTPFPLRLSLTPHRHTAESIRKRREGYSRSRSPRDNIQGQLRQARPFGFGKADAPNGPFETLSPWHPPEVRARYVRDAGNQMTYEGAYENDSFGDLSPIGVGSACRGEPRPRP
jgi:hypothetical protein